MDIIVGTAGHIDHGKTALVKSLTGIDADRLPEEKQRGITIDIGFAELDIGGVRFGFVDVPGHERFVKNMLAGATGVDLVLLVIAADKGVMPQTREHFEICRLLGIKAGLIVLTKTDLVDSELLELVKLEAAELVENSFLEDARIIALSAKTGEGIEELKQALLESSQVQPARRNDLIMRLPVDRSFTVKGFGTVVTGTLASGEITETDELELLPVGRKVRVRGLQTHGQTVQKLHAGQRSAVNLAGIDHGEIVRGMILCESGILRPTQIFDAEVEVLSDAARPLKTRQRVRLHIGTAEVLARVFVMNEMSEIETGGRGFVQLRLESPTACLLGERFILRSYSPQITIAGGAVIFPNAEKHRRRDIPAAAAFASAILDSGDDKAAIVRHFVKTAAAGFGFGDLQARTGWRTSVLREAVDQNIETETIADAGGCLIASASFEKLLVRTTEAVAKFHRDEPLASGMSRETLRERVFRYLPPEIFAAAVAALETNGQIVAVKDVIRSAEHRSEMSSEETAVSEILTKLYSAAGCEPPKLDEALAQAVSGTKTPLADARKIFQLLIKSGEVVKVSDEFYFSSAAIEDLKSNIRKYADGIPERMIDVPRFKEIAGVSRKYAIPLLEYFDREKITRRAGDKRLIL